MTESKPTFTNRLRGVGAEANLLTHITDKMIDEVLRHACCSPRRRAIRSLHRPTERLQRMLNAGMRDTYVAPHVHDRPRKLEVFLILRGAISVALFDENGSLANSVTLSDRGPVRSVEIPAGTWHSFVVLTRSAVVYELIDGAYDPSTHKHFAPWAPREDEAARAAAFLKRLKRQIGSAAKR